MDFSPEFLSALIGLIYDCALEPSRWEATLGEIAMAVGSKNAMLSLTDMRYDRLLLNRSFGIDPEWWLAFQEKHFAEASSQLSAILLSWSSFDRAYVLSRHLPPQVMQGSAYQQGLRSAGIFDVAQCFLIGTPTRFAGLAYGNGTDFTDRQVNLAELLTPHIRRAIMISDVLDVKTVERDHLASALNLMRCAVILTASDGKIVFANSSAIKLLSQGNVIREHNSRLSAVSPQARKELRNSIKTMTHDNLKIGHAGAAIKFSEDFARPSVAHILPLSGSHLRGNLEPDAVAAVFIRQADDVSDNAELFAATYQLTGAETRLLSCLLSGRTLAESATELRIAISTARTHLDHIFEKTGVGRQIDLLLLAQRLSRPTTS